MTDELVTPKTITNLEQYHRMLAAEGDVTPHNIRTTNSKIPCDKLNDNHPTKTRGGSILGIITNETIKNIDLSGAQLRIEVGASKVVNSNFSYTRPTDSRHGVEGQWGNSCHGWCYPSCFDASVVLHRLGDEVDFMGSMVYAAADQDEILPDNDRIRQDLFVQPQGKNNRAKNMELYKRATSQLYRTFSIPCCFSDCGQDNIFYKFCGRSVQTRLYRHIKDAQTSPHTPIADELWRNAPWIPVSYKFTQLDGSHAKPDHLGNTAYIRFGTRFRLAHNQSSDLVDFVKKNKLLELKNSLRLYLSNDHLRLLPVSVVIALKEYNLEKNKSNQAMYGASALNSATHAAAESGEGQPSSEGDTENVGGQNIAEEYANLNENQKEIIASLEDYLNDEHLRSLSFEVITGLKKHHILSKSGQPTKRLVLGEYNIAEEYDKLTEEQQQNIDELKYEEKYVDLVVSGISNPELKQLPGWLLIELNKYIKDDHLISLPMAVIRVLQRHHVLSESDQPTDRLVLGGYNIAEEYDNLNDEQKVELSSIKLDYVVQGVDIVERYELLSLQQKRELAAVKKPQVVFERFFGRDQYKEIMFPDKEYSYSTVGSEFSYDIKYLFDVHANGDPRIIITYKVKDLRDMPDWLISALQNYRMRDNEDHHTDDDAALLVYSDNVEEEGELVNGVSVRALYDALSDGKREQLDNINVEQAVVYKSCIPFFGGRARQEVDDSGCCMRIYQGLMSKEDRDHSDQYLGYV